MLDISDPIVTERLESGNTHPVRALQSLFDYFIKIDDEDADALAPIIRRQWRLFRGEPPVDEDLADQRNRAAFGVGLKREPGE